MKLAVLFTLLLWAASAAAQCTSGSSPTWFWTLSSTPSTLQTCINGTSPGDTVNISAGSATWTAGITISSNINIVGAGAPRIVAYAVTPSALTIGTGALSFTVTGATSVVTGTPPNTAALSTLNWSNGQTLRLQELGFRANFMQGTITSFNTSSGALVMNIVSSGGTCGTSDPNMPSNCKRWLIQTVPSSATVITNSVASNGYPFTLTESTSGNLTVSGIEVLSGSGTNAVFYLNRTSGGRVIVLHNLYLQGNESFTVDGTTSRGLIYQTSFENSPFTVVENIRIKDDNNTTMPTAWTTVSTFGTNDTAATSFCSTCLAGQNNFYVENNDFEAGENITNWDDNARAVFRYNFLNNAGMGSHGADTSNVGNRHYEIYNNFGVFNPYSDGSTANMNWWNENRGGTFVMHDNVFPVLTSGDYGTKNDLSLLVDNVNGRNSGPHPCWGEGTTGGTDYYAPRQTGIGYVTGTGSATGKQSSCPSPVNCSGNVFSGSTDFWTYVGDSEPIYSWANARTSGGSSVVLSVSLGADLGQCTSPDSASNYIESGRDYFDTTGTAKPGYTPYTYPHPLDTGGSQATAPICTPTSGVVPQTVTCTNPNSGTTVSCYAVSPTNPATNGAGTGCTTGTQYTTALNISSAETLNIIAGTSTLSDSSISSYTYTAATTNPAIVGGNAKIGGGATVQ